MNRRHNFEKRLNIVSRILQGEPIREICRNLQLDAHDVRQWYLRYQKYGEDGLRGTRSFHYSAVEKRKIVMEFLEKGVPLQEICLRYNLSRSALKSWIRKVRKGESLENRHRGRSPKDAMHDLRKKNRKQNWKNFRQKIFA